MSFMKKTKCQTCKYVTEHNVPPFFTCNAYPTGIPNRIFCGEKDHDRHRPFDKGYRYEPKEN